MICCVIVAVVVLTRKMSEYYGSLSIQAKARYEEKLKLAGLNLEEDPYDERNANKYKDDMTALLLTYITDITIYTFLIRYREP